MCVSCACVLPPQQTFSQHWFCLCVPSPAPVLLWHQSHLPHCFLGSWQLVSVSIPAAGTPWKCATNPTPLTHFQLAALTGNIAAHLHGQMHFRDDSNLTLLFVNTAAHCSGPQRLLPQISRRIRHQGEWVTYQ